MRILCGTILAAAVACSGMAFAGAEYPELPQKITDETVEARAARMAWWRPDRFGMGGAFYSVGYPSKAFHAVNGYALRRMARFLNRKSQRHYRLRFADTYYGDLNHYGMRWLRWADVRRRRY